ncbi:MAG: 3-phosphoshikimate 1-carboxyvinyltransferase [Clostridia bacterium]|nr:3-phosphoshikimate 1-carboxyvinyltransferase [Clostridia bacterium]
MKIKIEKSTASGTIKAPPSKSMAHRLLICSGLAKGVSTVSGIAPSEDVLATLDCLEALGARYSVDGDTVTVEGVDLNECKGSRELFCRESGSTLRFFLPMCLMTGSECRLHGSETLLKRPMSVYEDICREQELLFENDGETILVKGPVRAGNYKVKGNISSQFISGLLFVLPLLPGDSTLSITPPIESCSYINLTIQALHTFGVSVCWKDERTLYIKGGQSYAPGGVKVEGDYSNAAFFSALSHIGGNVNVDGLSESSLQGDRVYFKLFDMIDRGTPTIHISDCPDLGPILFALSACKNGGVFTGTARLKIKESDRAAAMAEELEKFGVSVRVNDDSVVVYPAQFHAPSSELSGHNDHRIVMSLAVMLSACGGVINGAEAVSKSMPDFFDKLKQLGIKVTEYADNQ